VSSSCRVEQEQQLRAEAEGEAAAAWRKAKSYKKRAEKAAYELDTLAGQERQGVSQEKHRDLEARQGSHCFLPCLQTCIRVLGKACSSSGGS
jgi:hypothetical protein